MIVPKIRCQSGPENARWIHGCASERPAKQNIESDCRSDGKTSDPASPFVYSSAIDNKDEEKRQNRLDQNSLSRIEIDGKLGGSGDDHIAPKQAETDQSSDKTAKQLRDPIANGVCDRHVTATKQPESHRRI